MNKTLLIKCVGIFFILMMFIAVLGMVEYKVMERQSYRNQATQTVANGWSQSQVLAGPVFELDFSKDYTETRFNKELKKYEKIEKTRRWSEYRLLESLTIDADLVMQERYVGIFKVPVYTANAELTGRHKANKLSLPENTKLLRARLLVSVSDIRGLSNQPDLIWNDKRLTFQPGDKQQLLGNYLQTSIPISQLMSDAKVALSLKLRGVDRIGIVPIAQNIKSNINAPWPHPSFMGRYLPSERNISDAGFNANWQVNSFASSIVKTLKDCATEPSACAYKLRENQFGVQLGSAVDVYQMTDRALKYGFMFVCLTFIVFSLLELQKRYSIHPIQYGFVGAALAVFYLLVISLSEHIRFDLAYLIGSIACSGLIAGYLKVVLSSTRIAGVLGLSFLGLYAMMYAILQSEDYAFLMGTILIFALLAGVMFGTRKIDWQSLTRPKQPEPQGTAI